MSERVDRLDVGTRWEPNAPDAVLVADDQGTVVLALNAHPEDEDHRAVTLVWSGAHSATMSDPNDEAISGHRLYRAGLDAVHWAGVVHGSELIADLEARNRVHPGHDARQYGDLRHYVLPLKECVVEVVATHLTMSRVEGSTKQAVATVLARHDGALSAADPGERSRPPRGMIGRLDRAVTSIRWRWTVKALRLHGPQGLLPR